MTVDKVRVGLLAMVGACIVVIGGFCYHRANANTTVVITYDGVVTCKTTHAQTYDSYICRKS